MNSLCTFSGCANTDGVRPIFVSAVFVYISCAIHLDVVLYTHLYASGLSTDSWSMLPNAFSISNKAHTTVSFFLVNSGFRQSVSPSYVVRVLAVEWILLQDFYSDIIINMLSHYFIIKDGCMEGFRVCAFGIKVTSDLLIVLLLYLFLFTLYLFFNFLIFVIALFLILLKTCKSYLCLLYLTKLIFHTTVK